MQTPQSGAPTATHYIKKKIISIHFNQRPYLKKNQNNNKKFKKIVTIPSIKITGKNLNFTGNLTAQDKRTKRGHSKTTTQATSDKLAKSSGKGRNLGGAAGRSLGGALGIGVVAVEVVVRAEHIVGGEVEAFRTSGVSRRHGI